MSQEHDARNAPLADRVAYATVVGSMAAADLVVQPSELDKLSELCKALDLPDEEAQKVRDAAQSRPGDSVQRALKHLKGVDLRYALYTDCLLLAHADGRVASEERRVLDEIAGALGIDEERAAALEELAQVTIEAMKADADENAVKQRSEAVAAKLTALGVPTGALAVGSAAALSAAGVTTGLAAVAAGLGIATGFGAVLGLGIGTVYGVRWLQKRWSDSSKE